MAATDIAAEGGFTRPVFDAQHIFRAVMDAMARPGTVMSLASDALPPAPMNAAAGAVALTLCDHDTALWLDPRLSGGAGVAAWLAFHTGAPVTAMPADAQFAFVSEPALLPSLEAFAQGSQEYPDRSTTLIIQVESLDAGAPLTLRGPGIFDTASIAPDPLPRRFVEQWAQNNRRFPRGVDLVLAAPGKIAALPRTTRVNTGGNS